MIPYIGDISKADAEVLKAFAIKSERILEFGCGASTQVLSKYSTSPIVSLDTSIEWVNKTIKNLKLLEIENIPLFPAWLGNFYFDTSAKYDFIFNDGIDSLRKDFALKAWPILDVGGVMAFHDTRRWQDVKIVCNVLEQIYESVDNVIFNFRHSNITLVYKKEHEPYENWQIAENKEQWELGYGEPDIEIIKKRINE